MSFLLWKTGSTTPSSSGMQRKHSCEKLPPHMFECFPSFSKIDEVLSSTEGKSKKSTAVRELTPYEKLSLAVAEHDIRTQELKKLEEQSQEDIGLLKALIDGIKIRINELRKETYSFRSDVVQGAVVGAFNAF